MPATPLRLSLGMLVPDGLVNVDGKEGAGRVEDGGQVGHECGQHHGNHDTPGTG